MTFKLRPYQATFAAAVMAAQHARHASLLIPDDVLRQQCPNPLTADELKLRMANPGPGTCANPPAGSPEEEQLRAAETAAAIDNLARAFRTKPQLTSAWLMESMQRAVDEAEREEQARLVANGVFLRSVEHIKHPDPRAAIHGQGAGPFHWPQPLVDWWHRRHPGLGLPLNVKPLAELPATPEFKPLKPSDVLVIGGAPRGYTSGMFGGGGGPGYRITIVDDMTRGAPFFIEPKRPALVDRDSNPHKSHLTRGAQWKRERGRRR